MDASRVLLGLMQLSRRAAGDDETPDESLDGVIAAGVLRSLLSALHFRDVSTVRHVRRVAQLAVGIAGYLGWEGRHLKVLEIAALLHDVGKIGVPDNILFKPSALSTDEADLMALHHAIGYDVLQACRVDKEVLDIVGHVRDSLSGTVNQNGRGVPMGSRILAVADAYDSLRADQVYRSGKSHEEIMRVLLESSGTQFDVNIVRCLARWTQEVGIPSSTGELSLPTPTHTVDALEASSLCHIFSFLYLMESLYDGFFIVDGDLRINVWSGGAERLLGKGISDMVNRVWSPRVLNYVTDEQGTPLPDDQCPINVVVQNGKPIIKEVRVQDQDGRWLEIETQTVPLLDSQGQMHGIAEILRDRCRTSKKPQEFHHLRLAATRDALTGVANRGELETNLTLLLNESARCNWQEPFSVIFLDVDHFKSVNDTFGHTSGDKVLIEVARTIQQETYSGELLGRYGGEEFVILCPGTNLDHALNRANRIRVALTRMKVPDLNGTMVTASFGVAEAGAGDSVESVLRRADKALYNAKRTGRNRACSLTVAEMAQQNSTRETARERAHNIMVGHFTACIPTDMVVYKLGGFVSDEGARLLEVAPNRAVVRLGSRGLLPFWGSTDDLRPVDIEVEFGDERSPKEVRGYLIRSSQVQVTARVRPIGWVRDPLVFESRARRALKKLCAYFAAELRLE